MKARIFFWSITSALAGFLFGFDTVVISGAEQKIQSLWNLSPGLHGMAMAAALYGTVLGSLLGGWPTDRFGRKLTLTFVGVLYIISAVGCGFAWDVTSFVIARFIGGLGIGISTVAAPLYISEISPPAYRGRLAGMFQFNIVFGILIAFASNAAAGRDRGERLALDAGRRGVSVHPLHRDVLCPARKPALADRTQRRPRAGLEGAQAHRTRRHAGPTRSPRGRNSRGIFGARDFVAFLDVETAHPDPAGVPHRVFQPTLRHQRHPLLRPAHLRPHGQRERAGAIGGHRVHQSGLHLCRPVAD